MSETHISAQSVTFDIDSEDAKMRFLAACGWGHREPRSPESVPKNIARQHKEAEQEELESTKLEPTQSEPAKSEQSSSMKTQTIGQGSATPIKEEPDQSAGHKLASDSTPINSEPTKSEPAKSEPPKSEPAKSEPAKSEPSASMKTQYISDGSPTVKKEETAQSNGLKAVNGPARSQTIRITRPESPASILQGNPWVAEQLAKLAMSPIRPVPAKFHRGESSTPTKRGSVAVGSNLYLDSNKSTTTASDVFCEQSLATKQNQGPEENKTAPHDEEKVLEKDSSQKEAIEPEASDQLSTGADIISLGDSASLPSVNLVNIRPPIPPRPDYGYESPDPSISALSVSSIHGTDDDECLSQNEPDFRGKHGPDCNIEVHGNMWIKKDAFGSDGTDYYDLFHDGPLFQSYIASWRSQILPSVAKLDVQQAARQWNSQVDVSTNSLMAPMEHPDTFPRHLDQRSALDWRRQTWTTSLHVGREADRQRKQRPVTVTGKPIEPVKEGHCPPTFWDPNTDPEYLKMRQAEKEERERADAALPDYSLCSPRIPAYLRPAKVEDMAQVMEIYNWEVTNGIQALDAEPLRLDDFLVIFKQAEELGMPFLVAVYGSAKALNIKNNTSYFTKCTPHPDGAVVPDPNRDGKILGFAYLSVWEPGLAGSAHGSSRASAKVNLYVHPEYRRKRIGFCLLDRLLMTVSERYSSASSYDFVDPKDRKMYQSPESNDRKFWKIYLGYRVAWDPDGKGTSKEEVKAIRRMLTDTFNFTEAHRFEMAHRTPGSRPGPVTWLDSLVFQHGCYLGEKIRGAEKY